MSYVNLSYFNTHSTKTLEAILLGWEREYDRACANESGALPKDYLSERMHTIRAIMDARSEDQHQHTTQNGVKAMDISQRLSELTQPQFRALEWLIGEATITGSDYVAIANNRAIEGLLGKRSAVDWMALPALMIAEQTKRD